MKVVTLCSALALLVGCTTYNIQPPAQPTPASLQSANVQLGVLVNADGTPLSPIAVWQTGDYAVRAACHGYLNQMASRAAGLNLAGGSLGLAGPAAAGFLVGTGNPAGAAAAGAIAALGQTFLNLFQSSGSIPYTAETSTLIEQALDTYEIGVTRAPPTSIPQAVSFVDDLWFNCSAGGYAMLVSKAISSASLGVRSTGLSSSFLLEEPSSRPVILVNPQNVPPPIMNVPPQEPSVKPKRSTPPKPQLSKTEQEWENVQRVGRAAYERSLMPKVHTYHDL